MGGNWRKVEAELIFYGRSFNGRTFTPPYLFLGYRNSHVDFDGAMPGSWLEIESIDGHTNLFPGEAARVTMDVNAFGDLYKTLHVGQRFIVRQPREPDEDDDIATGVVTQILDAVSPPDS